MAAAIPIIGSIVGSLVSSMLSKGNKSEGSNRQQAAPAVSSPTAAPAPDGDAVAAAKRRSIAAQVAQRGRASTILSGSDPANNTGSESLGN